MSPTGSPNDVRPDALPAVTQRSVLADQVYDILREGLMTRRIEPGARLNLDRLGKELHVSNTPVRQALARLEADGLVTKEPYRGFTASPLLDSRTIAELYDYRLIIEPKLAARAARRRRSDAVASLDTLCDELGIRNLISDAAVDALGERDIEFHCLIADEAGNHYVTETIRATLVRMSRYTLYHTHGAAELAWAEHRVLADAIRASDPEAAATAMVEHLSNGLERANKAIS